MISHEPESAIFRRLSFGESYARALAVFVERWDVFLAIGLIVFVPYVMFMVSYMQFMGQMMTDLQKAAEEAQQQAYNNANNNNNANGAEIDPSVFHDTMMHMQGQLGKLVLEIVLYMFCGIIGGSAMSRAVAEIYAGQVSRVKDCLSKAFARFCQVFCASWIVGMAIGLGYVVTVMVMAGLMATKNGFLMFVAFLLLVAFFVAVIYIQVAMMLATPVVMVENKGPVDTIKRCWELANNNRCFIFCTLFVFMFVYSIGAAMVFSIIFSGNPMAQFTTWGAIIQTLPYIIVLPATVILSNVVYLNVRIEREGMNRQVLLRDLNNGRVTDEAVDYSLVAAEGGGSSEMGKTLI